MILKKKVVMTTLAYISEHKWEITKLIKSIGSDQIKSNVLLIFVSKSVKENSRC